MSSKNMWRAGATASVCAVVGAGVGIATSAASPRHAGTARITTQTTRAATTPGAIGPWGGWFEGGLPVHADVVVLDQAGTGYITQTVDDGTISSVSGNQLAIKEGSSSVSYKTVTLSIPSDVTVRRDGNTATLGDLKTGDYVIVSQSSEATSVNASDRSRSGWPSSGAGGWRQGSGPGGGGWSGTTHPTGGWSRAGSGSGYRPSVGGR